MYVVVFCAVFFPILYIYVYIYMTAVAASSSTGLWPKLSENLFMDDFWR